MNNKDEPAYPVVDAQGFGDVGMTKYEVRFNAVLQGVLSSGDMNFYEMTDEDEDIKKRAIDACVTMAKDITDRSFEVIDDNN